ncbi:MAG: CBS domain-containing protein, partial [Victivallaceae bacterium]|nr:CBS domain-containing protein [Victivallaceae bacterium]
ALPILSREIVTLLESDTLAHAIETFATTRLEEIVVLDNVGDLRGVISLSDLLHYSLPEHLLWMEDLSPIYQFQPFAEMLKSAGDTRVADVMRDEFITVSEEVPAIQLAKQFWSTKVRQLVIVSATGKLVGVVDLGEFCSRLFWE